MQQQGDVKPPVYVYMATLNVDFSAHSSFDSQAPASPLFDEKLRLPRIIGFKFSTDWSKLIRYEPEQHGEETLDSNKRIPAGWTYFGQLVSHDLSCRRGLNLNFKNPALPGNQCPPALNLDTMYGLGPAIQPFMYELRRSSKTGYDFRGVRFLLETSKQGVPDVPRKSNVPLIADARNDDNYLLSQLLCLFLRFHNRVAEYLYEKNKINGKPMLTGEKLFLETRALVTWTYQWLIVHEYLEKLVQDGLVSRLMQSLEAKKTDGFILLNHKLQKPPELTPEFSHAAMRLGHSQVREKYVLTQKDNARPRFISIYSDQPGQVDLRGFSNDPRREAPDWSLFFGDAKSQKSRLMDLMLAAPLNGLPFLKKDNRNLGAINLQRSKDAGLVLPGAAGALLKGKLGIQQVLNRKVILNYYTPRPNNPAAAQWVKDLAKVDHWPLWAYILMEARIFGCKPSDYRATSRPEQTLGPLGSHIVAEQILWVLHQDINAYQNCKGFSWHPYQDIPVQPMDAGSKRFSVETFIHIAENGISVSG